MWEVFDGGGCVCVCVLVFFCWFFFVFSRKMFLHFRYSLRAHTKKYFLIVPDAICLAVRKNVGGEYNTYCNILLTSSQGEGRERKQFVFGRHLCFSVGLRTGERSCGMLMQAKVCTPSVISVQGCKKAKQPAGLN